MFRKIPAGFLALCAVLLSNGTSTLRAEVEPGDVINFAYATWVGTGYYKIGDRRAYILRGDFSYMLRDYDEKNWGLELLLPATIGYFNFSDLTDVSAITFIPGLKLVYPVLKNWWLKPYVQFGVGKDFSGDDLVAIGGAGVKSLALFPIKNGIELELGNNLTYADNSESGTSVVDNGFSMFEIGLNSRWPLNFTLYNRQPYLNVFFVYTDFINELVFLNADRFDKEINRIYTIGIFLEGKPDFSILGIKFPGGGLDFSFGKNYRGIGLVTGFPF